MIHRFQRERMEINEVSWNMQCRNLPTAILKYFIASRNAIQKQRAVARPAPLGDNVITGLERCRSFDDLTKCQLFARRDIIVASQIQKQFLNQELTPQTFNNIGRNRPRSDGTSFTRETLGCNLGVLYVPILFRPT